MNDKCKELVFVALGTASMCWNPRPGRQVFVSEEALEVGNQLIAALDKELAATDSQHSQLAIALIERLDRYERDHTKHEWPLFLNDIIAEWRSATSKHS